MSAPATKNVFIGVAIAAVVIAVAGGLIVLRPPSEERARRLDERRVQDLRGIARAMDLYWTRHGGLPASLQDLSGDSSVTVSAQDPDTAQDYELRVLDGAAYELCASFERSSAEAGDAADPTQDVSEDFWSHGVGRRCFGLQAQEVPSTRQQRQP